MERYQTEHKALCARLAAAMEDEQDPTGPGPQALAAAYAALVYRWFYPCDAAHLGRLADMYRSDSRFRATFDAHCDGLSDYVIETFEAHAKTAPA